jgi:predicted DNA-binding transcriptional regulator AlpA
VARLYGISNGCAWAWSNKGLLPKPEKLGPRVTGWRVGDLWKALAALHGAA